MNRCHYKDHNDKCWSEQIQGMYCMFAKNYELLCPFARHYEMNLKMVEKAKEELQVRPSLFPDGPPKLPRPQFLRDGKLFNIK